MKYLRAVFLSMLLLVCAAAPVRADTVSSAPPEGIDVSSFNNTVDWSSVAEQGIKFAMIRTAEGLDVGADDVDRQFEANYAGAKAAGLKVGVYHVCCHKTVEQAELEADYCLKILNGRHLDYPVAYDIEHPNVLALGKAQVTQIAKAFCDKIAKAGYTPMIYSSVNNLNQCFDWNKLKGVKVWVAHWGVEEPAFTGTYHIWQYTSTGIVPGAGNDDGDCDRDLSFLDAQSITLNRILGVKETFTLKASVYPSQSWDEVTFSSSDNAVATVNSSGVVTGRGKGTAIITAKAGDVTAECVVTVIVPDKVKLPKKNVTLKIGKTYKIGPKIANGAACYKYTYKSSKKSVATVSANGKVTAKKKGTATITVKTFNGKTAKLKVKVK